MLLNVLSDIGNFAAEGRVGRNTETEWRNLRQRAGNSVSLNLSANWDITCFKMYLFFPTLISKLAQFLNQRPEESAMTEIKIVREYGKNLTVLTFIILARKI
jgi:hypothetical protein